MTRAIRDDRGFEIGWYCDGCGKEASELWGGLCRSCQHTERRHNELLKTTCNRNTHPAEIDTLRQHKADLIDAVQILLGDKSEYASQHYTDRVKFARGVLGRLGA